MTKDNPDTIAMEEQSEWEATQVDDVFLPSVQVQIGWRDVEAAVETGAIVPTEAHGLWAAWAAPGSPLRRGVGMNPDVGMVERAYQTTVSQDLNTDLDELPPLPPPGGGMKPVITLLIGAVAGAALMYVLGS